MRIVAIVIVGVLIAFGDRSAAQQQPPDPNGPPTSLVYKPLENRREDLDLLQTYWPLREDDFLADFNSLQAYRWAIVVFEARGDAPAPSTGGGPNRSARQALETLENGTTVVVVTTAVPSVVPVVPINASLLPGDFGSTTTAVPPPPPRLEGGGLLDNKDALDEIDYLRKYIEEDHKVTVSNQDYYYGNVCMSRISPITNRSTCRFPELTLSEILDSTQRQRLTKNFHRPSLYPYFGDRDAPLGVKLITGPLLGGVEIDRNTGDLRAVRSLALKYFFKTQTTPPDGIDGISTEWRNSLRDYVLNKHRPSSLVDFRYLDDEMMRMRLDSKTANPNLAERLLDPTPSAGSRTSAFWPSGLTAQLIFSRVPDLSRDAEYRAILKTLASFENTPYTFGEEGTVCWLRSFVAWRKWLVANLYGGGQSDESGGGMTVDTTPVSSPFGNFHEDLRIFLQNPYYPVWSQHVAVGDLTGDGRADVKAFRCLITLKNTPDQDERTKALTYLRELAAGNGRYNISVIGMDFLPPVAMSARIVRASWSLILVVPLAFAVGAWSMAVNRW